MAIKLELSKFATAYPTKMLASVGGKHVYNLFMDKDRSNGEVVARDGWKSMDLYTVKESTGVEGVIREQAANGNWYVEITKAGDGVLIRTVPLIEEQYNTAIQSESNFYNARNSVATGLELAVGDIIELSEAAFTGTPEATKTLTIASSKWVVGE